MKFILNSFIYLIIFLISVLVMKQQPNFIECAILYFLLTSDKND